MFRLPRRAEICIQTKWEKVTDPKLKHIIIAMFTIRIKRIVVYRKDLIKLRVEELKSKGPKSFSTIVSVRALDPIKGFSKNESTLLNFK